MSIQKLITLNILFSSGKPNNTHSSRWSKLEISNSLIFVHHLKAIFPKFVCLSHFRRKCWMSSLIIFNEKKKSHKYIYQYCELSRVIKIHDS